MGGDGVAAEACMAASPTRSSPQHTTSLQSLMHRPLAPADAVSTFYFVVFPCNCAPIFHSNCIPFVDSTPPYVPGDVVSLGPAEEVAQQKLQELAFPLRFGCKSAGMHNGQFWSSRLEPVRRRGDVRYYRLMIASTFVVLIASENGKLRTMHTKYAAVALVITCPPDKPHYKFLLDNFDSVLRNMLHISLDFAMWATQRFFIKLTRTAPARRLVEELEQHAKAVETYCILGSILANALSYTNAIPRMRSGAGMLTMTNMSRSSFTSSSSSPQSSEPHCVTKSVESLLYDALGVLCRFSESFTSSVVAGLISLSNWEGYGHTCHYGRVQRHQGLHNEDNDDDMYGDYWRNMKDAEREGSSKCVLPERVGDDTTRYCSSNGSSNSNENSNNNNNSINSGCVNQDPVLQPEGIKSSSITSSLVSGVMRSCNLSEPTSASGPVAGDTPTAAGAMGSSSTPLLSRFVGRVVIFCTDPHLAQCLLIMAAFFFRDRRTVNTFGVACQPLDTAPFAGRVGSYAHPSLPVQWVTEEYDQKHMDHVLCSPHSVENVVLVIAPRAMVCRRLSLLKTFNTTPILVERFKTSYQPVRPFQNSLLRSVDMLSDHLIRDALREARHLHVKSGGAVNCAEFLELSIARLIRYIYSCCYLQQEKHELHSPFSAGLATSAGEVDESTSYFSVDTCLSPPNSTYLELQSSDDGGETISQKVDSGFTCAFSASGKECLPHATVGSTSSSVLNEMRVGEQLLQLLMERCN